MKRLLSFTETMAALFLLAIALLIACNLMWGFAVATYYGSHICVDIVWEHLDQGGRRVLDVLSTAITMLFLGATAWMVWNKVLSTGSQTTSDLQLPIVYFYAVAAMGVVAATVLAALRVVRLASNTAIDAPDQEVSNGS
jgi:TRAP-type C4-dicarboxylate transport system permease small subunit